MTYKYHLTNAIFFLCKESGRAGRDGQAADCLLFWRLGDLFKQSTMVHAEQTGLEKLYAILAYAIDTNR